MSLLLPSLFGPETRLTIHACDGIQSRQELGMKESGDTLPNAVALGLRSQNGSAGCRGACATTRQLITPRKSMWSLRQGFWDVDAEEGMQSLLTVVLNRNFFSSRMFFFERFRPHSGALINSPP